MNAIKTEDDQIAHCAFSLYRQRAPNQPIRPSRLDCERSKNLPSTSRHLSKRTLRFEHRRPTCSNTHATLMKHPQVLSLEGTKVRLRFRVGSCRPRAVQTGRVATR